VRFKNTHGHVNVSSKSKKFKKLGCWVNAQRRKFKLKTIEPARAELLKLIDFQFNRKAENHWDTMFIELQGFKQMHGHSNVSVKEGNKRLYLWLLGQRSHFKAGKLEKEKVEKLESIGVDIDLRGKIWDRKFR
jgi:hypothetical protein